MASFIMLHELESRAHNGIGEVNSYLINVDMIQRIWIPPEPADTQVILSLVGEKDYMRLQETYDELVQKLQAAGAIVVDKFTTTASPSQK